MRARAVPRQLLLLRRRRALPLAARAPRTQPVMWLLLSELYPIRCRGLAMSIGSTTCWVMTTAVVFTL